MPFGFVRFLLKQIKSTKRAKLSHSLTWSPLLQVILNESLVNFKFLFYIKNKRKYL